MNSFISSKTVCLDVNSDKTLVFHPYYGKPLLVPYRIGQFLKENRGKYINCEYPPILESVKIVLQSSNHEIKLKDTLDFYQNQLKGTDEFLLIFVPSYTCNASCEYCLTSKIANRLDGAFLDERLIEKIPKLIKDFMNVSPIAPFRHVAFKILGGEPTLPKNWIRVKYALEVLNRHFKLSNHTLVTNGTYLTNDVLKNFVKFNGDTIHLSFNVTEKNVRFSGQPDQRNSVEQLFHLMDKVIAFDLKIILALNIDDTSFVHTNLLQLVDRFNSGSYSDSVTIIPSKIETLEEYSPILNNYVDPAYVLYENGLWHVVKSIKNMLAAYFPRKSLLNHKIFPCKPASLSSVLIYPDGKFTLCGRLYADRPDNFDQLSDLNCYDIERFISVRLDQAGEECMTCEFKLFCGGKCLFDKNESCTRYKESIIFNLKMVLAEIYENSIKRI